MCVFHFHGAMNDEIVKSLNNEFHFLATLSIRTSKDLVFQTIFFSEKTELHFHFYVGGYWSFRSLKRGIRLHMMFRIGRFLHRFAQNCSCFLNLKKASTDCPFLVFVIFLFLCYMYFCSLESCSFFSEN